MELAFAEKSFRDLCFNNTLAKQAYGDELSIKLKRVLADLSAATVVADLLLLPGSPSELTGDFSGHMAIRLANEYWLLFQSGHVNTPLLQSGNIDWSRVRRIKLLGLDKNHE